MTTDATTEPQPDSPPLESSPPPRGDVISLLLGGLPGLVFAAYITGLLFFLNPELELTPFAVLRGLGVYGTLFAVVTSFLSLLVAGRSGARARALLPWSLTLVLALAATSSWWHASVFSYFLHPGLNVRLIKAAILFSAAALTAFLTALLHTIDGRPYGRRSRALLAILSVAVLYIMVERRSAFEPPPPIAPLPSETTYQSRPDLWVIALEGATLDAVLPLAEQGHLPFFAQLLERGASARIEAMTPIVEPALWTTVATGRFPYNHKILAEKIYSAGVLSPGETLRLVPPGYRWWGFFGARARPVDATHRRTTTLWEILSRLDIPAGVVGWPAAHPVQQQVAFAFADRYFDGSLLAARARPAELAERGVLFRVTPEGIDPELLEPLGDPLSYPFLRAMADDVWRESLTTFLLDQSADVDALFLRLEGLAEVSRRYYGGFAGVQFDGAQDPERQEASRLLIAYYRHLDRLLASLVARKGGPGEVMIAVVSAYGFQEPRGWRRLTALSGRQSLAGSSQTGPDGMILLSGPGVLAGQRLQDTEAVDIMPTLLYGLGLPIARDLDGRVLTAAFETSFLARHPLTFVPSYDTLGLEETLPLGLELLLGPAEPLELPDQGPGNID